MKIGLYFGSFNPIHIGHLIIAEFVCNHTDIQQVWFVVSPQNPFKKKESLLNSYNRLHLVNLAVENDPCLKVSDAEFKLPQPSYTFDTLSYLQEKYPDYHFNIVLGSDGFQNIKKWKNADWLLSNYSFLVYRRPSFEITDLLSDKNKLLTSSPLLDISSTYIREQIRKKKGFRYMLPEKVYDEIIRSHYYQ